MISNALQRLAAALARRQSSFVVAEYVQFRPLLTTVNSYPQIHAVFLRPFTSLFPTQRSWTPEGFRNVRSKRSITTSNERRLEYSLGKRSLEGPRARGALILHQDLRHSFYTSSWPQNRTAWQIHRSSSTTNRGERRFGNAPLPKKLEVHIQKDTPESSKFPASSIANKHIINRLPNIPHMHRPTKEELLAAATGFWSRLKVRFKWFSIRSVRPFNVDEIGAFFSWFLLGHVLWIILGTTTFFSLAIFAVNTVFAQGMSLSPYSYLQLIWPLRNSSSVGRKLFNKIFGGQSCFRICYRTQMARRSHHVQERLCIEATRPRYRESMQRLFVNGSSCSSGCRSREGLCRYRNSWRY